MFRNKFSVYIVSRAQVWDYISKHTDPILVSQDNGLPDHDDVQGFRRLDIQGHWPPNTDIKYFVIDIQILKIVTFAVSSLCTCITSHS